MSRITIPLKALDEKTQKKAIKLARLQQNLAAYISELNIIIEMPEWVDINFKCTNCTYEVMVSYKTEDWITIDRNVSLVCPQKKCIQGRLIPEIW